MNDHQDEAQDEPSVGVEVARALLARGNESEELDYKELIDLDDKAACLELARDVAAFSMRGGYILVGADDGGRLTQRVGDRHWELFDDATVRGKVRKYLPASVSFEIGRHMIGGHRVILVRVEIHQDGVVAMAADGVHGNNVPVFREGEQFARHGTRTERVNQHDLSMLRNRLVDEEKRRWLAEELPTILASLQATSNAASLARAPIGTATWNMAAEALATVTLESLRSNDPLPVRMLLMQFKSHASAVLATGDEMEFERLLDGVAAIGASALLARSPEIATQTIQALLQAYELPTDQFGHEQAVAGIPAVRIWAGTIQRVYALGALATRLGEWTTVRELALQSPRVYNIEFWGGWLRHCVTMYARSGSDVADAEGASLLVQARDVIKRTPALRPDHSDDEDTLTSLCQFDALAGIALVTTHPGEKDGRVYYPNFAPFEPGRVIPAIDRAIHDSQVRSVIAPVDDQILRTELLQLIQTAHRESLRVGFGADFFNDPIERFLNDDGTPGSGRPG